MYGDQFGEFVCGYWDLKGSENVKSGYRHALMFKGRFT